MHGIGEAALNFIKEVGEIDPQITSYRDFTDMKPILSTFYKLFKIEPEGDEESQIRSMVRFLQINTTHDNNIAIEFDKLKSLDIDQIENVACLMFYCMQSEDRKEEFEQLLSKLDESDRETLLGSTKDDKNSKQEDIKKMAKNIRDFVNAHTELAKLKTEFANLDKEYNEKIANSDQLVQEEEMKLRQNHSSSQNLLNQITSEISELESRNSSLLNFQSPDNTSSSSSLLVKDEDLDKLQMQHEELTKKVDELKDKVSKLQGTTTEIDEYREKKKQFDIETEPLRQQYKSIHDQVEEVQKRMDSHEEEWKRKNADLIVEVDGLKEKKTTMLSTIDNNIEKLKLEKSEGETAKKIQSIIDLRKSRDELKKSIEEMKTKVLSLQQALAQGKIDDLNLN